MPKISSTLGFWEYEERIKQIGGIGRYTALVKRLLNALRKQPALPLNNYSKPYACTRDFYAPQSLVDQLDLYVKWRNSDRTQIIRQGLNAGLLNAETMFAPPRHWGKKGIAVGVRLTNRDLNTIYAWLSQPSNIGFTLSDALRKIASNLPLPASDPACPEKHAVKIPFYDEELHLNLARTAQAMELDLANVIKGYMCLSLHPERQNRITRYLGRFLSKPLMAVCPPPSFSSTVFETGVADENNL